MCDYWLRITHIVLAMARADWPVVICRPRPCGRAIESRKLSFEHLHALVKPIERGDNDVHVLVIEHQFTLAEQAVAAVGPSL